MYLTKLLLNAANRDVLRDLASPHEMHRTLLRAFPSHDAGGPGRVLFRIEPITDATPPIVLVQSEKEPDWSRLAAGYGRPCGVKPLDLDATVLSVGRRLRFRLLANPTIKRQGSRHGLFREDDQRTWLIRKAAEGGFSVDVESLLIVPVGTLRSRSGGTVRSWFGVRFDGALAVVAPDRFCKSLVSGLGSGKAFGFGLLSVAPL
jgi:CRISPR system Cascade subunit CasE